MDLLVKFYYKCCGFYTDYYNYISSFWGSVLFCCYNISVRGGDIISSMVFWTTAWVISCIAMHWWNKKKD